MKVFSIIGKQKMREDIAPKLIKALEEDGHTVGFIKKTDNISSNSQTKRAVIWGEQQSLFYHEEKQTLLDLLELFDEEYVVVDNDEKSNVQKLLMYEEEDIENTDNIDELGSMHIMKRRDDLFFTADSDTDFEEIIKAVKEKVVDLQPLEEVELFVGGDSLRMDRIIKTILKNNVEAVATEVDGYKEDKNLQIRINK